MKIVVLDGHTLNPGDLSWDDIKDLGGRNAIFGEGGDDHMAGGLGDDVINGGPGNDRAIGGLGHDRCSAEHAVSCEAREP